MLAEYWQKLRMLNREVRLYLVSLALVSLAQFGIGTLLTNLYLIRLAYGPGFIGLFNGLGLLLVAGFSLPAGALGAQWGTRRTMIAGMTLMIAGFGLLPLGELAPANWRSLWLLATSCVRGLGTCLFLVTSSPFLTEATSPVERDHAFSVESALYALGSFLGSLIGGLLPGLFATTVGTSLDQPAPYRQALLVAVVLSIPALVILAAIREARPPRVRRRGAGRLQERVAERGPFPVAPVAAMAAFVALRWAGVGATSVFFNVYLDASLKVSTERIGAAVSASQLACVLFAMAMPPLVARWGRARTIWVGELARLPFLLPLALVPHWGVASLGRIGSDGLGGMTRPAYIVYGQEIVARPWRGVMSGALSMATALGLAAMSVGGGYVVEAQGYRAAFLMAAGLIAASSLVFWTYSRVPRPARTTPDNMEIDDGSDGQRGHLSRGGE